MKRPTRPDRPLLCRPRAKVNVLHIPIGGQVSVSSRQREHLNAASDLTLASRFNDAGMHISSLGLQWMALSLLTTTISSDNPTDACQEQNFCALNFLRFCLLFDQDAGEPLGEGRGQTETHPSGLEYLTL